MTREVTTGERREMLRRYRGGETCAEIAQAMGRSRSTVTRHVAACRRTKRRRRPPVHSQIVVARRAARSYARDAGTTLRALQSANRVAPHIAGLREVCCRLREDGYSYPTIGVVLHRHHTTIIHHIQHAQRLAAEETDS